jgi:hypothetical protein
VISGSIDTASGISYKPSDAAISEGFFNCWEGRCFGHMHGIPEPYIATHYSKIKTKLSGKRRKRE